MTDLFTIQIYRVLLDSMISSPLKSHSIYFYIIDLSIVRLEPHPIRRLFLLGKITYS